MPVCHVRVSIEVDEKFKKYASKNSTTRSRIMRKYLQELVTGKIDLLPSEIIEFQKAIRQLAGVSSNLNQLTRSVNSGAIRGALANDLTADALKQEVARLAVSLRNYVKSARKR